MNENEKSAGHTVERVTYNGIELSRQSLEERNESEVARVVAALEQIERADAPTLILSTATTW